MANIYVYGTIAIAAGVLNNHQMQVRNFNWILFLAIIAHNCAFIDITQRSQSVICNYVIVNTICSI